VNLHTDLAPLPEDEILKYFLGTAQAVSAMHGHVPKKTIVSDSYPPNGLDLDSPGGLTTPTNITDRKGKRRQNMEEERMEEEEEEEEGLGKTEDERQEAPLMGNMMSNHHTDQNHHHQPATKAQRNSGSIEPWAHRDLKPANVLISDDDRPILMDFGSAIKARIPIPNRSIALQQQDLAAELSHSSAFPLHNSSSLN
jgi:serine/threonine kinase 16